MSAPSTPDSRSGRPRSAELVEEPVLLGLQADQGQEDLLPTGGESLDVTGRVTALRRCRRALRHQGPNTAVVGLGGQVPVLFVEDAEFLPQTPRRAPQPAQPAFDEPTSHGANLPRPPAVPRLAALRCGGIITSA